MVVSDEMNLTNYKKWLKAIESELKSTRAATGRDVAVDRSVLNIPQKVTSTGWVFKEHLIVVLRQDRLFSDGSISMVAMIV